jgi:DNA-binding NtrC family response regulator
MTHAKPNILVVDDDRDACHNISDILTDLGYAVDVAHDGPTALEKVRARSYDVALLDLKMPGMSGLELYREIRKFRSETVAIIITAHASATTAEEAMTAGAWKVFPKPVDFPHLLRLVEQALGQPLVMVIDDDTDLCANLWDLLRDRGYRVATAHDAEEATEKLRAKTYQVVLIDMKLPRSDGLKLFQMVRANNPGARTVMITGFRTEMEDHMQRLIAEGADAVCYKPFDVVQLLETLEELCPSGE